MQDRKFIPNITAVVIFFISFVPINAAADLGARWLSFKTVSSSSRQGTGDRLENTAQEEIEEKIRRIAEQYKEGSQREIAEQISINAGRLNVRSGPGTTHPVVYTAKLNHIFLVLEKTGGWIKIEIDSNTRGWVSEKYVKYVEYLSSDTKSGQVQEPKAELPSTTQETSVVKPAPTGVPETVAPVTTMSRSIFASAAKKLLLITLIVSIFAFSIINRKLGLKHWWILPLISLMVLAIFLPGMLADLHYELDELMKLLLVLGCLIGAIAIAYISESRWTFVLLLFGGLPLLVLAHKIFGVWIGIILTFATIWLYGLSKKKLYGKTKPKKASIGIIKYIPITIVGLSYIVFAMWFAIERLSAGELKPPWIVPCSLWFLLGMILCYRRKFAIIVSLITYPAFFAVNTLSLANAMNVRSLSPFYYTPFHHISDIIPEKDALLSVIGPYWTFYPWAIYAIHFICLFPYLFVRSKRDSKRDLAKALASIDSLDHSLRQTKNKIQAENKRTSKDKDTTTQKLNSITANFTDYKTNISSEIEKLNTQLDHMTKKAGNTGKLISECSLLKKEWPLCGRCKEENVVSVTSFISEGSTKIAYGAVENENKDISIYDMELGAYDALKGHQAGVTALAIDAENNCLISVAYDGQIIICDFEQKKILRQADTGDKLYSLALAKPFLFVGGEARIWVYDLHELKMIASLDEHEGKIVCLTVDEENSILYSGEAHSENPCFSCVYVWDIDEIQNKNPLKRKLRGFGGWVTSLALSPDGKSLACGEGVGSPSSPESSKILLWDTETLRIKNLLEAHDGWVESLIFSHEGKWLISGDGVGPIDNPEPSDIFMWNMNTNDRVKRIKAHNGWVRCLRHDIDGRYLISGGTDGVLVWNFKKCESRI